MVCRFSFSLILLLGFLACSTSTRLDVDDLGLPECLAQKNEEGYIQQFPKNFDEFSVLFAWNGERDEPGELYDDFQAYIDYWFELISTKKFKENEKYIIEICKNGEWQPNGIDYFQDQSIAYIKNQQAYYLINDLEEKQAFSVLLFLFHSSGSEYDEEFANHLDTERSKMLKSLFQISDELPIENVVESYSVDVNGDGVADKINVLQNQQEEDEFDRNHFGLDVQILLNKGNDFSEWKRGKGIIFSKIESCSSEGFSGIEFKDNQLHVYQQTCREYNILVDAKSIFQLKNGELLLVQHQEEYFNKADHEEEIPSRKWTSSEFGKVKFEDISSDFWRKLHGF